MQVDLETNFSDIVDVSDFVPVDIQQKRDKFLCCDVEIILPQRHEGHDERMLLLDLIEQNSFGASFSVRVEEDGGRDSGEEKDIKDNEQDEESIDPGGLVDSHHLIVRVVIVG